jgi:hypothetical protein
LEGVLLLMMLVHIIGQYYLDPFDVHVGAWKLEESEDGRRPPRAAPPTPPHLWVVAKIKGRMLIFLKIIRQNSVLPRCYLSNYSKIIIFPSLSPTPNDQDEKARRPKIENHLKQYNATTDHDVPTSLEPIPPRTKDINQTQNDGCSHRFHL